MRDIVCKKRRAQPDTRSSADDNNLTQADIALFLGLKE